MPYTFKTNQLERFPRDGEEFLLVSGHNHVRSEFSIGDRIYVFVENNSILGKVGGLVARGVLLGASPTGGSAELRIRFDGVPVSIGLATRDLDRFAHPQRYSLPELKLPALSDMFKVLQDIAEIRRNTTGQPVHKLSDEGANWLDLYHFQKEKR
jgi:hypothetical protein